MANFAICDSGLIEAKSIPERCFGPPGGCPAGIYHTFYRHDGYVGLLELRLRYFVQQMEALGHDAGDFSNTLFSSELLAQLLEKEKLSDNRARVRMMIFDQPVALTDGRQTKGVCIVAPVEALPDLTKPFRCAVAPRRRLEITDNWDFKRLGRGQIDADLAEARAAGYDDVLYLDRMGNWCEASYANIVAVFGKRICLVGTPGLSYQGLTSGIFTALRKELKPLQVHSAVVGMRELSKADEVFLTSAVRGLQPVTEIEGVGQWALDHPDSVRNQINKILLKNGVI